VSFNFAAKVAYFGWWNIALIVAGMWGMYLFGVWIGYREAVAIAKMLNPRPLPAPPDQETDQ
jgi:hypothetical protein